MNRTHYFMDVILSNLSIKLAIPYSTLPASCVANLTSTIKSSYYSFNGSGFKYFTSPYEAINDAKVPYFGLVLSIDEETASKFCTVQNDWKRESYARSWMLRFNFHTQQTHVSHCPPQFTSKNIIQLELEYVDFCFESKAAAYALDELISYRMYPSSRLRILTNAHIDRMEFHFGLGPTLFPYEFTTADVADDLVAALNVNANIPTWSIVNDGGSLLIIARFTGSHNLGRYLLRHNIELFESFSYIQRIRQNS